MDHTISRRTLLGAGAAVATGLLLKTSFGVEAGAGKRRVVVWSEGTAPKKVYPNEINGAIAEGLKPLAGWEIVTATLTDAGQGVPEELLAKTDVLMWWGHKLHGKVTDETVARIVKRVKEGGMGFISLHSSHFAKANKALMGTPCSWAAYKGDTTKLKVIVKDATHPIAKGVSDFTIENAERYDNPYAVSKPDALVFDGEFTHKDGSKSPSQQGFTWTVGKGRFFYFQPGHETNPIFFDENVRRILRNAVEWAAAK